MNLWTLLLQEGIQAIRSLIETPIYCRMVCVCVCVCVYRSNGCLALLILCPYQSGNMFRLISCSRVHMRWWASRCSSKGCCRCKLFTQKRALLFTRRPLVPMPRASAAPLACTACRGQATHFWMSYLEQQQQQQQGPILKQSSSIYSSHAPPLPPSNWGSTKCSLTWVNTLIVLSRSKWLKYKNRYHICRWCVFVIYIYIYTSGNIYSS